MINVLTIKGDFTSIFNSIKDFFINIWSSIRDFFLQYVSQEVFNIFVFAIVITLVLFIILAIMNKN